MARISKGLLVFSLFFPLIFVSCYRASPPKEVRDEPAVTIRFAHNWSGRDGKARYFEPILDEVAEDWKPRYNLHVEASAPNEYASDIKSKIATGDVPDVYLFWATESLIRSAVELDAALDMRLYLAESQSVRYEDFVPFSWKYTTLDDTPYAVPMEVFYGLFLVNEELFDKYGLTVPEDREEFVLVCEEFLHQGHIPLAVSSQGGDPGHLFFSALALQYGEAYFASMDRIRHRVFDTEVNRKTASTVEWLFSRGYIPGDLTDVGTYNQMVALYNKGRSPMIYTFPWVFTEFSPEVMAATRVYHLPNLTATTAGNREDLIGGVAMALFINPASFNDARKKPAIIKLVDTLLSEETFLLLSRAGMIPSRMLKDQRNDEWPLFSMVYDYVEGRVPIKSHEIYFPDSGSLDSYRLGVDYLFTGTVQADEFIEYTQKALENTKEKQ